MSMLNPFTPSGPTATLAGGTSTGNVAVTRNAASQQVMVTCVAGGALTFVKFGGSTVTAAITDIPILPGTQRIFSLAPDQTYAAAITGASTSTLYFTPGNGG